MITERPSKDAIFHAAADLADAAEQRAYRDDVCAGDSLLHQEIEDLFELDRYAGKFLESPPPEPLAIVDHPPEPPGTWVGTEKLCHNLLKSLENMPLRRLWQSLFAAGTLPEQVFKQPVHAGQSGHAAKGQQPSIQKHGMHAVPHRRRFCIGKQSVPLKAIRSTNALHKPSPTQGDSTLASLWPG
jgi:hypothetical protein